MQREDTVVALRHAVREWWRKACWQGCGKVVRKERGKGRSYERSCKDALKAAQKQGTKAGVPILKAKGRAKGGFFANKATEPYQAQGQILGQSHPDSCVAAACRMLILDLRPELQDDIRFSESYLRDFLATDEEGALVRDIPGVLTEAGIESYEYRDDLTWRDLRKAVQWGPAIVRVFGATPDDGHVLIVEQIVMDSVAVRDSLPPNQGTAYWIHQKDFRAAWRSQKTGYGKAVIRVK